MSFRNALLAAMCASAAVFTTLAQAQQPYPVRPVRVIVPLGAGGVPDVMARAVGEVFAQRNGFAMVVENRPGANTIIGAEACASAPADGHTLCVLSASTLSANPSLYRRLPYDATRSFEPVAMLAVPDMLFAANPSVTATNLREFTDYGKRNQGKLNYGSFGVGSDTHLTIEWIKRQTGLDIVHVPFNGFGPMMQAFHGGDIQVMYLSAGNPGVVDLVNSGKMKGIALHAKQRSPLLPKVQTFSEAGLPPLQAQTWFGLLAPTGTPSVVIAKLNAEIAAIMQTPAMRERIANLSMTWPELSPAQFAEFLARDRKVWGELVTASGAKLE